MILYILLISSSNIHQSDSYFTHGNDEFMTDTIFTFTELGNVNWEQNPNDEIQNNINYEIQINDEMHIIESIDPDSVISGLADYFQNLNSTNGNPQTNLGNPQTNLENPQTNLENPQTNLGNPQTNLGNSQTNLENPQTNLGNPQTNLGNPQTNLGNVESQSDFVHLQTRTTLKRRSLVKKCNTILKLPVYWEILNKLKLLDSNEELDGERIEKFVGKQFLTFSSYRKKIKNWRLKFEELHRKYCLQILKWMKSRNLQNENFFDGMNLISECLLFISNSLKFTRLYFIVPDEFINYYKLSSRRLLLILKEIPICTLFDEIEFLIYKKHISDVSDYKKLYILFQFGRKRIRNMLKIYMTKNEIIERMICMVERAKKLN